MNRIPNAIRNAAEHVVAVQEHGRRVYHLEGKDGLDLLHRLSTNDLFDGPAQRSVLTAFCNEKGKLLEAAEVVVVDGGTFVVCSAAGSGKLLGWIAKFTVTEDIQLTDVTSDFLVYSLLGPRAFSTASRTGLLEDERQRNQASSCRGISAWAWDDLFGTLPSVRILARQSGHTGLTEMLSAARVPMDESRSVYDFLRVLHGVPEYGHEIAETFTPYDVGLTRAISFTKGCYIGQEVIARVDTYKKVRRGLRLLWSDAPDLPRRGTAVVVAGENVGVVTSAMNAGTRIVVLAVMLNKAASTHEVIRITDYPYVLNQGPVPPFSMVSPLEGT
jgi:tRNA-modifying protein YgfZ